MDLARQKLDLIEWISRTRDAKLLQKLSELKQSQPTQESVPIRRAGWGKDVFVHVAEDFDATPPGFEAYLHA